MSAGRWVGRAALLCLTVTGCIGVPDGGLDEATFESGGVHTRSAIYFFREVQNDILSANAYDFRMPTDTDDASMVYTLVVDGPMVAKLADIHFEGGSVELQFTLREGFSFVGAGGGSLTGTVAMTIGGGAILADPLTVTSDGPTGTRETTYRYAFTADETEHWQVGDTITVTLTGSGTARSNGIGYIDQSIVSWYFKAGGKPMLKAYL